MKLALAIGEVAGAERRLADGLLEVGERHRADHDVFHVTRTLSELERGHVAMLEPHAERHGAAIDADGAEPNGRGLLDRAMEKGAELVGRAPEASLALLGDLRRLHELAARASIEWVILGQGAQAARDEELLSVVGACHPETLRTLKWTTYRIKEAAPQTLLT